MTDNAQEDNAHAAASDATTAAPPPSSRPAIRISLKKKPASSSIVANNKRVSLSLTQEYSTVAQHAESISQRRREEGEVLVIPCKANEGDGPILLAQREKLLRPANDDAAHRVDPPVETEPAVEDDLEATLQLIQSAHRREEHVIDKSSGLTIAAPTTNALNARSRPEHADEELFRRDLSLRADDIDPTSSAYAHVGIRDFGGALLRGMGWTGGSASTSGGEIQPRPHRLGLGATPLLPPPDAAGKGSGLVRRARRPEEVKREEERLRMEEERERERLEKQRLDVQFTLQKQSVVWVYGRNDDHGKTDAQSRVKARVLQTAGIPGLNRILVQMEDGQEKPVNKGSVELCSWEELEESPFRIKERDLVHEKNGKREERRDFRDDARNERNTSNHKNDDNKWNEDRYRRKTRDQETLERHRDHTRNDHRRDDCSDDDSHYRRRRKASSHNKECSDDDDNDSHHRRRHKESSRDKRYSDDDSHSKQKRKDSSHRKRDRSKERDRPRSRTKHRDREDTDDRKRDKWDSKRSRHSSSVPPKDNQHHHHLHWLLPNIRVRLVSKRYPRQHLQKGIVQDVISSSKSDNANAVILMDNQEVLDNIPERYLETALPKTGGNVIVLEGCHRWKKGRLLERSSERSRGIIQLFEDLEVVEVSLDGVAEWCGPVDEDLS